MPTGSRKTGKRIVDLPRGCSRSTVSGIPILAVVLCACLAAMAVPSTAGAAALTVTPGTPKRGDTMTLTASGFAPGARGLARLSGRSSVAVADDHGRAHLAIRVPPTFRLGNHRLTLRAGSRQVSTLLTIVSSERPPSLLQALSGGQRALLSPARAGAEETFTMRVTGLRPGATVQERLAGIAVAQGRADPRGSLSIVAEVPAVAAGPHLVDLVSGHTRIRLKLLVLAESATTGEAGETSPALTVGQSLGQVSPGLLGSPVPGAPPAAPPGTRPPPPGPQPPPPPAPQPPPPPVPGAVRIAAAGDIACPPGSAVATSSCHQLATSNLLVAGNYAAVLPLGDVQYFCGSLSAFNLSYGPTWGRVLATTHPVVGNHEYLTAGDSDCTPANARGAGYFDYFGARAGSRGQGYYSYDIGAWHLIALNSNCGDAGGCGAASAQAGWLAQDLAAHRNTCTLAYWHIPLFSSGGRAAPNTAGLWGQLDRAGADVVLAGHDHIYERFAPQSPTGVADPAGIRELIVGTGGSNHTAFAAIAPNSQVRNNTTFGVLELTLAATSYSWNFRPESGGSFTDAGSSSCH